MIGWRKSREEGQPGREAEALSLRISRYDLLFKSAWNLWKNRIELGQGWENLATPYNTDQ